MRNNLLLENFRYHFDSYGQWLSKLVIKFLKDGVFAGSISTLPLHLNERKKMEKLHEFSA